jgi:hypothetical protein
MGEKHGAANIRQAAAATGRASPVVIGTDGATTLPPGFGAAPAGMPPYTQRSGLGPPALESLIGLGLEHKPLEVLCSSTNTANVSGPRGKEKPRLP